MSNEDVKTNMPDPANDSHNNADFIKKYNEIFKNSFPAESQTPQRADVDKKPVRNENIRRKEPAQKPADTYITDTNPAGKKKNALIQILNKIISFFKKFFKGNHKQDRSTYKKSIDIDIYSTDDIDLPLDLPKNLMDPESTETQLAMFEGIASSEEVYAEPSESEASIQPPEDTENENQIRIEDLIKESILASRMADPYADKIKYDPNETISDTQSVSGDTMVFQPVKTHGFQNYKSVDEILREVNISDSDNTGNDSQMPRRRRNGAAGNGKN